MVRVDMSPARLQISKRQKRRKLAAERRAARARRVQAKEIAAAAAARRARLQAIETWDEEEKRLEQHRAEPDDKQPQRAVRFSDSVLVTAIPVEHDAKLPEPVSAPIGVAVSDSAGAGEADDGFDDDERQLLEAVKSSGGSVLHMDDDWSDNDDEEGDPPFQPDLDELPTALVTAVSNRSRRNPTRLSRAANGHASRPNTTSSKPTGSRKRKPARAGATPAASTLFALDADEDADGEKQDDDGADVQLRPIDADNVHSNSPPADKARKIVPTKLLDAIPDSSPEGKKPKSPKKSKKRRKPDITAARSEDHALHANGTTSPSAETQGSDSKNELTSAAEAPQRGSPEASRRKKKRKLNGGEAAESIVPALPSPQKKNCSSPSSDEKHKAANGSNSVDADKEEIDSMFGELVKKRAAQKEKQAAAGSKAHQPHAVDKVSKHGKNGKVKHAGTSLTRFTDDGLRIVSYDEMAADQPKGLNGPCPFECSCCF